MRSPAVSNIQKAIQHNLPTILSAAAVAGVIGTVILAVKATPGAMADIDLAKQDKEYTEASDEERSIIDQGKLETQELTIVETVKACWRCYIPAALMGSASIACIIGANAIGLRRQAALLGAYTLADTSFREYKEKVLANITEPKAKKIDEEILADRIAKDPPKTETIVFAGGDQLCYDSLTGRYFKSTAEKIRRAAQDLDARILQGDMYASQNEFYDLLGLDGCTVGATLGWTIENRLKVVISAHVSECDQPCLAIGYEKLPVYNYDRL